MHYARLNIMAIRIPDAGQKVFLVTETNQIVMFLCDKNRLKVIKVSVKNFLKKGLIVTIWVIEGFRIESIDFSIRI